MDTDRNLLFGVLALQADLLDAPRFVEACTLWANQKHTPLADLLVERGWLTAEDRGHVEYLLERKLKKHGGDAHASLAAVASVAVQRALADIPDPDVQQTVLTLPPPSPQIPEKQTPASTSATRIGERDRYALLHLHAQGGIGRVWLARDEDLGRDVALKELHPEQADVPAVVARFVEEAKVTGQLEHPGIVPVHELARRATDGQFFYTMRFIKGRTLHDAVREYHEKRRAGQAGPLDLRELLTAFVAVCNAVAYANSRGVLHRDLKPQNVALGDFGEVLVLDWGLARVLGQDERAASLGPVAVQRAAAREATQQGQVLGTPSYMPPEQAEGHTDRLGRHSDVYGLGAVLYEILTGVPPFTGPTTLDILMKVVSESPLRPGQRVATTPPALEAVCLKALAKQPEERYSSAKELAQEVERWLADEPVSAYRDPLTVRLVRWGRRHQKLVTGGTALLLTAVVALVIGLGAVERERVRTAAANEREREARQQAEANFALAKDAVDRYLTSVTEDKRLKEQDFFELRKKLLETAVPFYERFAQAKAGDPEQEAARGRAYWRLAFVRGQMGEKEAALADYERGQAVFEKLAADFPAGPDYRQQLAGIHNSLGLQLAALGKRAEAEAEYRKALALQEKLAADFPTVPDYRHYRAWSHNNLGLLLAGLGKWVEAEAEYRQALALQEKLAADFPSVPKYRWNLAKHHHNLGNLLKNLGQRAEAETENRQAIALCEKLVADFPTVPEYRQGLAGGHNNLGNLLKNLGRRAEAEAELCQALALKEKLAAEFPSVPAYREDLAASHNNLGILLKGLGKRAGAEAAYRQALALQERLAADFPSVPAYRQDLATSHHNLGNLLKALGKLPAAETAYCQALALREHLATDYPTVPAYRQDLATSHHNLGQLLVDLGKRPEAETAYRQALALYEQLATDYPTVPAYRQDLATSHHNLGQLLVDLGKRPEAETAYRQALALYEQLATDYPTVPAYRQELAHGHTSLGLLLRALGLRAGAEAEYRRAIALQKKLADDFPSMPDYCEELAVSHNKLGLLLAALGQRAAAETAYRQALALQEKLAADFPIVPAYAVDLGGSYCNIGILVFEQGDPASSLDWYAKAVATLRAVLAKEPRLVTARQFLRNVHQGRATALAHLGRHADAAADWEQALMLNDDKPRQGWLRLQRAASLARAGQHAEATAAVEELLRPGNAASGTLYDAACVYALAAAQAGKQAPPNTSSLRAEHYARRAVALLRQAVQQGFRDLAHMKKDTNLDSLRPRPDFQQLLAELEAKAPAK